MLLCDPGLVLAQGALSEHSFIMSSINSVKINQKSILFLMDFQVLPSLPYLYACYCSLRVQLMVVKHKFSSFAN